MHLRKQLNKIIMYVCACMYVLIYCNMATKGLTYIRTIPEGAQHLRESADMSIKP